MNRRVVFPVGESVRLYREDYTDDAWRYIMEQLGMIEAFDCNEVVLEVSAVSWHDCKEKGDGNNEK